MPHRRPLLELLLAACAVAVGLGDIAWHVVHPTVADGPTFWAMPAAAAVGYGATAAVLAWAGRAVLVRRVLLAIAVTQAVGKVTALYVDGGLDDGWPLVAWAEWLSSWLWAPAYVAVGAVLPLVLPDGRPLWRWAGRLSAVAVGWTAVAWALTPYDLQDFPKASGLTNPVGVEAVGHPVVDVTGALLAVSAVAVALASAVVRWRRSDGQARDQLTWLLLGLAATVVLAVLALTGSPAAGEVLSALAMLPFPVACGVALLRHRLWDVDVVVSRSLAYGVLTGGVVAGYVAAVAVLGGLLGSSAGAPVLATAVVALGVLPLQPGVQRAVNRLVHGDADDPYTALSRLGGRLEAAADPGELAERVLPELVQKVARALHVPHAAVELQDGSCTVHGAPVDDVTRVPLLFAGAEVGALVVAGTDLSRSDRRLLDRLAGQAAVTAHSVLLARDVARARAQAATAREEERRRLRRDLHDGMGPSLAALALQAETARDLVALDPAAATALLGRLVPRLNEAVSDVRTLVHDLRPPTLDEMGLAGAVGELAARFTTPDRRVVVEAGDLGVLPAAVDLAAYRIVAEALANAARHSGARTVVVTLRRNGALQVQVRDDGAGIAAGARAGVGLRSIRERAEELGGSCTVHDDDGTTVDAVLPLPDTAGVPAQRERIEVPA